MSQERDGNNRVVTLTQFLAENDALLAALGIFSGLAVFSQELGIKSVASVLSFLFLGLTVVTWVELNGKFPRVREQSFNLYLFRLLLEIAFIGIIIYWLVWFHDAWRAILILPLWFACMYVIGLLVHGLLRHLGWRERLYPKNVPRAQVPFRVFILRSLFEAGIVIGAGKLAQLIQGPVSQLLDALHEAVPR